MNRSEEMWVARSTSRHRAARLHACTLDLDFSRRAPSRPSERRSVRGPHPIKYEHLRGLLGGGANTLVQVLADKPEFQARIIQRLADAFMNTDDITSALHGAKTPVEDATQVIRAVGDALGAAKK